MWSFFESIKAKRIRKRILTDIEACVVKVRLEKSMKGTASKETRSAALELLNKTKEMDDGELSGSAECLLSEADSHIAASLKNHRFALDRNVNRDTFDSEDKHNTANRSMAFGVTSTIVWHGNVEEAEVAKLGARLKEIGYFGDGWRTWVGLSGSGRGERSIALVVQQKWSFETWDTIRDAYQPMFPSIEELFLCDSFFGMYICDTTWFNRGLLGKRSMTLGIRTVPGRA